MLQVFGMFMGKLVEQGKDGKLKVMEKALQLALVQFGADPRFISLYKRTTLIILRKVPTETLASNPEEFSRIVKELSNQSRTEDLELRCLYFIVLARSLIKSCPSLSVGDLKASL